MSDERATVRPVTLSRLVELTHACNGEPKTTANLEDTLDVSHRRARETVLEATRITLLEEDERTEDEDAVYKTTDVGKSFLEAIRSEDWEQAGSILATRSPHYGTFIETLEETEQADLDTLLEHLEEAQEFTPYSFNQTGIEVVGDWAERLGSVQRHAFTGNYYVTTRSDIPQNFHYILLNVFDDLEQTAGVDLHERYLSIPQLREDVCERLGCRRGSFDEALLALCQQNVGKLELSGAPMDTTAKDAALGIKQIELADDDGLVTTSQSTQQVMSGVELYDKKYYYLAVHDREITFDKEDLA
ncbi:hypothetical protein PNQ29_08650 [Halobacterium salinarum]|uniref:hypothetical protein n=1 Tax=Halobacterium TaxID=2239 RepID=UPI002554D610|nr:hypothetical protein [Halobacterium salinarum]MDL0118544.1 hypothetical protein [Halobacterium salinarum]MDL0119166.1 hypothetical protein [Halobacterium salinarum]MDL0119795.1 hypothetical protein [Halobacterium salinarum]